jgi:hypothetical protein
VGSQWNVDETFHFMPLPRFAGTSAFNYLMDMDRVAENIICFFESENIMSG